MITIVDYGMGNIKSISNMLRKAGHDSQITGDPAVLKKAEKIILPGIGAFDNGIYKIKQSGIFDALNNRVVRDKIPVLGICLGMQLFANSSEEGEKRGLGWIDGDVKRFNFSQPDKTLKVPHMGWNYVNKARKHPLFENVPDPMRFYFVHSFHFVCNYNKNVLATSKYGYDFVCSIAKDNIMGVQFHPEKSHKYGLQLLNNFAEYF